MIVLTRNGKLLALFCFGVFFSAAPLWVPHIQQIWGRNTFATVDSMVLLGFTLLVSLLAAYFFPDFFVIRHSAPGVGLQGREIKPRGLTWVKVFAVACGFLSLVGLVYVLYWINQNILHAFLSSADEHSCYFLAECLRKGKLYVDLPPLADFFKVVHVGMRSGKWFSVYPPGWPLIWAIGLQFNIADWLNPMLSSLSVFLFFLAGKRLFGTVSTLLGLTFMVVSPFFMFTAASYFSHGTCFLCISVFLYAFLRWREAYRVGRDPIGWASLCALAVGYGLMTRYLTMAAVAGPFLLYHYLPILFEWIGWRRGNSSPNFYLKIVPFRFKRPQLRNCDWIAIGVISFFMVAILYQNYLVTGKPFKAPNKFDKSWERLGFRKDYTPVDGVFFLIARVFYLMDWFAPALVGVYLISLFAKRELSPVKAIFRFTMVFIVLAYFFYYSWGGNQWGPRYLWEGMPFLCIAVANWIVSCWQNGGLRIRKFLLGFVIVSVVSSGILFVKQAEFTEEASIQRKALYALAEQTINKPAIVFIHGFLGSRLVFAEEDAIRNSPFLDTRILYAHDLGGRNKELQRAYPNREFYRGTYDPLQKKPLLEKLS